MLPVHAVRAVGAAGPLRRSTGPPLGAPSLTGQEAPGGEVQPQVWFWPGTGDQHQLRHELLGASSALTLSKAILGAWVWAALQDGLCI